MENSIDNEKYSSILTSVKKLLGIDEEYEAFDPDLIMHINGVFMILNQLGVGPENTFSIVDKTATWNDFSEDPETLSTVKTYIYLKVRMIFDPPTSSIAAEAFKSCISELEWRLNVSEDETY